MKFDIIATAIYCRIGSLENSKNLYQIHCRTGSLLDREQKIRLQLFHSKNIYNKMLYKQLNGLKLS